MLLTYKSNAMSMVINRVTGTCLYSETSLIRTPVIRAPPSAGQLILSILC